MTFLTSHLAFAHESLKITLLWLPQTVTRTLTLIDCWVCHLHQIQGKPRKCDVLKRQMKKCFKKYGQNPLCKCCASVDRGGLEADVYGNIEATGHIASYSFSDRDSSERNARWVFLKF